MSSALWYLLRCHWVGSWRFRWQQLRHPKYLLGMLVVVGYFCLLFWSGAVGQWGRSVGTSPEVMRFGVGLFLVFQMCLIWVFAGRQSALGFSPAETEILFAAPLTREQLIQYRLLKSQPPLLFSATFLVLFFSFSQKFPSPVLTWVSVFVLFNLIFVFQLFSSMLQGMGQDRTWGGLVKMLGLTVILLPVAMSIPFEASAPSWLEVLIHWSKQVAKGQGGWMQPYFWLGDMVVVSSHTVWFLGLMVCMILYGLLYRCVVWLDYGFEEKEALQAQERTSLLRALRDGKSVRKDRPVSAALFSLRQSGAPWLAVFWKNVTSFTRHIPLGLTFALFYILVVAMVVLAVVPGIRIWSGLAVAFLIAAIFLTWMGSSFIKEDLRTDLRKLDIMRMFPISSRDILRGEVYGCAALVIGMVWFLSVASFCCSLLADFTGFSLLFLIFFTGLVCLVCPGVIVLSFAVENALAVMFPAWVLPDKATMNQPVQIDQMGRSILLFLVKFVLLFLGLLFPGFCLYVWFRIASFYGNPGLLLVGGGFFLLLCALETEWFIGKLAKLFERLDPSEEGLS